MDKTQINRGLELAKFTLDSIMVDSVNSLNVEIKRDTKNVENRTPYYSNNEPRTTFEIRILVEEK